MDEDSIVVEEVDGTDRQFSVFSFYDTLAFRREYLTEMKRLLGENLRFSGAETLQVLADLEAFDADPPKDSIPWLTNPDGRYAAFRISLKKAYGPEADAIAKAAIEIPFERQLPLIEKIVPGVKYHREDAGPNAVTPPTEPATDPATAPAA